MASSAGQLLVAGRVPGEEIAVDTEIADSTPTFTTTETTVMSVTAPLVSGRTYKVYASAHFETDAAVSNVAARLREDNSTGTQLQQSFYQIWHTSSTGVPVYLEAEFTAASTANKTFVLTGVRTSGSGNLALSAGATFPSHLRVEYLRG